MIAYLLRRFTKPAPKPTCYRSFPGPQQRAENDCFTCAYAAVCLPSMDFALGGTVWPGLSKLVEESGEVGQVGGKIIGSGGNPQHWSGDLVDKLVEELPDLMAAIRVFLELNPVLHPHEQAMRERFQQKVQQFRRWHFDTLEGRQ